MPTHSASRTIQSRALAVPIPTDLRLGAGASLAVALVLLAETTAAQEHVPNGSFEDYHYCPTGPGQVTAAKFWAPIRTSDFFHACGAAAVRVPDNAFGSQAAATGNGYGGFGGVVPTCDCLEFLMTPLNQPLDAGETYRVSLRVSASEIYSGIDIDDIGVHFSTGPLSEAAVDTATPQIVSTLGPIGDETNWVEIVDLYTAQGGENYLTIGNFDTTPTTPTDGYFYYYVDDVSVTPELACPAAGTVLDFNTLTVSGSGFQSLPSPIIENGVEVSALNFLVYGDAHPLYTGTPAIVPEGLVANVERAGGGTFDACTVSLSFGTGGVAFSSTPPRGSSVVIPSVPPPGLQIVELAGFQAIDQLTLVGPNNGYQVDDVCICPDGSCRCGRPTVTLRSDAYCVSGVSTGIPWSWRISPGSPVSIGPLPGGADETDFAVTFVASINASGPPGEIAALDTSRPGCFILAADPSAVFSVGPSGGPTNWRRHWKSCWVHF